MKFRTFLFCLPLIGIIANSIGAQQKLQTYQSPDRTFQVSVPKAVVQVIPPNSAELKQTIIANDVAVFRFGKPQNNGFHRFTIYEFDFSNREFKELQKSPTWMDYFAVLALGDDDEPQYLRDAKEVVSNRLSGKEYTYLDKIAPKNRFSRGRLFFVKNKLYILCFEAWNETDMESSDATTFFQSFKLLR